MIVPVGEEPEYLGSFTIDLQYFLRAEQCQFDLYYDRSCSKTLRTDLILFDRMRMVPVCANRPSGYIFNKK
jgi:hypothetical protein